MNTPYSGKKPGTPYAPLIDGAPRSRAVQKRAPAHWRRHGLPPEPLGTADKRNFLSGLGNTKRAHYKNLCGPHFFFYAPGSRGVARTAPAPLRKRAEGDTRTLFLCPAEQGPERPESIFPQHSLGIGCYILYYENEPTIMHNTRAINVPQRMEGRWNLLA